MPDGDETGVELRFLDADGRLLGRESRRSATFTWLGRFGDGIPVDEVRAIEVHGRLRAVRDGEHRLGGSGLGRATLTVDGSIVLEVQLALPEEADPVEALVRPPQAAASIRLQGVGRQPSSSASSLRWRAPARRSSSNSSRHAQPRTTNSRPRFAWPPRPTSPSSWWDHRGGRERGLRPDSLMLPG